MASGSQHNVRKSSSPKRPVGEAAMFLAAPSSSLTNVSSHSAAARRKRTTTLNSWHSAYDLNPDAVIRDDNDDAEGLANRVGVRDAIVDPSSAENGSMLRTDAATSSKAGPWMPKAPDGGWGWMCVLGCSIVHLILGGIGKSYGLIHVALTESLGESDFAVSWIHALSVCCRMCMGPLASMLFARGFSCRQIVMVGGFISMFMYFVSSLVVTSLSTLFVTMGLLVGFGGALVYTPSILIVGQYFDRHKAMANGFAVMGTGLGALIMPVVIQMSLSNYGLAGALLILGGVSFHSCVCGALYFPLRRENKDGEKLALARQTEKEETLKRGWTLEEDCEKDVPRTANGDASSNPKARKPPPVCFIHLHRFLHSLKTFFKEGIDISLFDDWTFWVLTASQFLSPFGFMPNLYYMPKLALALWSDDGYTVEERKVNAAFLISVNGIADIVGRAAFGVITNYGALRYHRALVYSLCPFVCAIGAVMAPFIGAGGFPYLAICAATTGCFSGGFIALTPSILSDAMGRDRLSSSFALTLAIKGIGALLAAPIAGSIVSLSLSRDAQAMPYTGVYVFTACASALSGIILFTWQMRVRWTAARDHPKAEVVGS